MKPYTRFLFRRARRVALIWIAALGVAYGLGAMKGIEERKNAAAASEAKMAKRIGDKWPELLSKAEYMTGMPVTQTERK